MNSELKTGIKHNLIWIDELEIYERKTFKQLCDELGIPIRSIRNSINEMNDEVNDVASQ